jgi:hypothetical protein
VKWDSRSVSWAGGIERERRERNRVGRRSDPLNALRRGRLREIRCRRDIFLQNGSGTLGLPQILAVNQNHPNVCLQKPWSSGQIRPQRRGRMQPNGARRKHAVLCVRSVWAQLPCRIRRVHQEFFSMAIVTGENLVDVAVVNNVFLQVKKGLQHSPAVTEMHAGDDGVRPVEACCSMHVAGRGEAASNE